MLALATALVLAASGPALITGDDAQLRCAGIFAIIASEQGRNAPGAGDLRRMEPEGREAFVRVMAARMDRDGLDQAGAAALVRQTLDGLQAEAAAQADPAAFVRTELDQCLPLLESVAGTPDPDQE